MWPSRCQGGGRGVPSSRDLDDDGSWSGGFGGDVRPTDNESRHYGQSGQSTGPEPVTGPGACLRPAFSPVDSGAEGICPLGLRLSLNSEQFSDLIDGLDEADFALVCCGDSRLLLKLRHPRCVRDGHPKGVSGRYCPLVDYVLQSLVLTYTQISFSLKSLLPEFPNETAVLNDFDLKVFENLLGPTEAGFEKSLNVTQLPPKIFLGLVDDVGRKNGRVRYRNPTLPTVNRIGLRSHSHSVAETAGLTKSPFSAEKKRFGGWRGVDFTFTR